MAPNNIKAECARFGYTRADIAQMLGVSKNSIKNWEEDIGTCKGAHLLSLSNIFGVSVDYLLGVSDERLRR